MNILKIKKDNDPFKKYWWAILLGFAGVGAWVCMPLMDTSTGSVSVRSRGLKTDNQSLDNMSNPSGAPGSAYDLSMDGAGGKKKGDGESTSSLYQAPPEAETGAVAPGAPLTGSAPGPASFANALKEVSRKTSASASWGNAKPQVAFTPPKGNFSSLSGLGGGGGGGTGASAGPASMGAFGTGVSKTGMTTTRGLSGGEAGSSQGAKPIMGSLKGAAAQGQAALTTPSADAARAMSGASFDGSRGGSAIGGEKGASAGGGAYAGFDAMPANLKANDPEANEYKYEAVPAKYAAETQDEGEQMKKAIMMMVISAVVGGVVTGVVGSVFGGAAGGAASGASGAAMSAALRPQGSGSGVGD
ncbi:MAG: hypothetical protein PHU21_05350 [Elusimicrobia bacterium]|nr:hypothetical protein [Elusimicrobiota bacterium]